MNFYLCILSLGAQTLSTKILAGITDCLDMTIAQAVYRTFSSNFGKRPLAKLGNDLLKIKLGEINDI